MDCFGKMNKFFSRHDNNIKIINKKNWKNRINLENHDNQVSDVKKIEIPYFGECLIRLWI